MTISEKLLSLLVCPENHSALRSADQATIDRLNLLIDARKLLNRGGKPVLERIEAGLVREDNQFLYPIQDNIPVMLIDESIALQEFVP